MPSPFAAATIIFDLDGTLVDSVPDLALAVDRTCADLGLPVRGEERVREWVGNGTRMLVGRALADDVEVRHSDAEIDAALDRFVNHYADCCCSRISGYPHVDETLRALRARGVRLALATNKLSEFTEKTLDHFGWSDLFDLTLSFDSLPEAKPHPMPLVHAISVLGGPAVMVGDSETDVVAAKRAGIPVIATSYGYNHGRPIDACEPDAVIDRFDDLLLHLALTKSSIQ